MASVTTTDEHIVVDRDYTDNFSVKETALQKLGKKYFGDEDVSKLNVGVLGFTLEQIANLTEDSFNTMSILINEAFPNKAVIPEDIYSHAAIFQIDNTYTACAQCTFVMLLDQAEVLKYATTKNNKKVFYIDKKTIISVEEIPFTLDYDIVIEAQKKNITGTESEYNFSAKYILDSKNAVSNVNDPYLKIRKLPNGSLLLTFMAHQVERTEIFDTITTNTRVNYPVKTYSFENGLAGFDIFYKAPADKTWTQLQKRIKFSLPIKEPFCYYKLKDEQELEITFSTRDGYFQPEFNSELRIVLYTTIGDAGKFPVYKGTHVEVLTDAETYEYNRDITIAVKPTSDSDGASSKMSLEALQALTVESYSSATEISSENDLYTYFMNFKYRYGNEINVIKRRDDVTERLYSAFLLMKNEDYIYPTNTLHLNLQYKDYDLNENDLRYTLKPGHVFVYADNSSNTMQLIPGVWAFQKEKVAELMQRYPFVYTNPFLISMTRYPNLVGLYQTLTDQTAQLDYVSANDDSFMQFITSKVRLTRNLNEKSTYKLQVSIIPSSSLDEYVFNLNTYEGNNVRVIAGLCNTSGEEVGYVELLPTEIDEADTSHVTFTAEVETNDHVSSTGYFPITNAKKVNPKSDYAYIPIKDSQINIYILYDDALTEVNKFSNYFDGMKYFTITNVYSNKTSPLTFIEPMNMMRSTVTFSNIGSDENPIINCNLSLLPVIKADIVGDEDNFNFFINRLSANYNYISECSDILRNNTNIDVKFYNTYGKSNNYCIGDEGELIDRVNLTIKFQVTLLDGADELTARRDLKAFIKEFVERVNVENGANNLYISNLIREVENKFRTVHHHKFLGINEYDTSYQTISVKEPDLNKLTKEERRNYVPEVLVVEPENILLSIISN